MVNTMSIDDELAVKTESKNLRAAMQWLSEQTNPHTVMQIEEASKRFNLSAYSEEILLNYFQEHKS